MPNGVRLDVFLDVACIYPTRTQAKEACEGGKVDLNGTAAKPHRTVKPGDTLQVTVSDSGPGIGPEDAARLFDAFWTTKSQGLGVGLAICRRLARDHGGSIHLESLSGEGTRAVVELPAETR